METIDKRIVEFISEHHVLTLATCIDDMPWCANCFYTFWNDKNSLIFTSDVETRHSQQALKNQNVAASIVLETKTIGLIRGVQILGTIIQLDEDHLDYREAKKKYLSAFPFAVLKKSDLWQLRINYCKLTDNRLGFGKKIHWPKEI